MLKCDPSQTKAVVVLLAVLAGAIVWTVARIGGGPRQQVAEQQASVAVSQVEACQANVVPVLQPRHNPFRKPDAIRSVSGSDELLDAGLGVVAVSQDSGFSGMATVDPLPVTGIPTAVTDDSNTIHTSPDQQPDRPSFALLATVGGPDGMTAVIRTDEAGARVVAVGDALEGGFRVVKIEADRAVLKDGRDTVVVKRPNG